MDPTDHPHLRVPVMNLDKANLFARVRAIRVAQTSGACPHCRARKGIQRWGTFSGRQRYRCVPCGRTFSDLTGTLLAGSKRPDAWMAFIHEFHQARPLWETAHRIGVHRETVFRWRHAILSLLRTQDLESQTRPKPGGPGPVSAFLEFRVPHSQKGQRSGEAPARPARSHGIPHGQRHRHERIAVILLDFAEPPVWHRGIRTRRRNRTGRPSQSTPGPHVSSPVAMVSSGCPRIRLSPPELASVLAPFVLPRTLLLAERQESNRLKQAAAVLGGPTTGGLHRKGARRPAFQVGRVPAEWVRGMRSFWSRFLRWLIRFRGVASHYLVHYLHWYRALERSRPFAEDALRPEAPGSSAA